MAEVIYTEQEQKEARARMDKLWACFGDNHVSAGSGDLYDDWASTYDKDLDILGYMGATIAVEYFAKYAKQLGLSKDARILDLAAGTGKAGEKLLKEHGYWNLEANDISRKMLDVARNKGIYKQYHIGNYQDLPLPENGFDAAMMSGYSSLRDLEPVARFIKPGGMFVTVLRANVREKEKKYVDAMEKAGVWECIEDSIYPQKYYLEYDAMVLVYKIL